MILRAYHIKIVQIKNIYISKWKWKRWNEERCI